MNHFFLHIRCVERGSWLLYLNIFLLSFGYLHTTLTNLRTNYLVMCNVCTDEGGKYIGLACELLVWHFEVILIFSGKLLRITS